MILNPQNRLDYENKTGFLSSYTHQTDTIIPNNVCDPTHTAAWRDRPGTGCASGTFRQEGVHVCVASSEHEAEGTPADPVPEHRAQR